MKHSLSELKKIVGEHKKSIPMLNSGKTALMAYAMKHKLLEADKHIQNEKMHEELSKKERDMAEKDLHKALSMVHESPKKKIEKIKAVEEKPKKMVHNLKEVQAIRKEKGVSLKEAWGIYLKSKK